MAKYSYNKSRDYRKVKPEVVIATIAVLAVILTAIYLFLDLNSNATVIDNSNNEPTFSEVETATSSFKLHNTDEFAIRVPENMEYQGKVNVILDEGVKYDTYQFVGQTDDAVGRKLEIYVDRIPADLPVNKVLHVMSSGNKIVPVRLSDQCYSFTDFPQERQGDPYESKWNNITFTCKTTETSNIIAAIEERQSEGVKVNGLNMTHNYLFVYTDHGYAENNALFSEILRTFEAK